MLLALSLFGCAGKTRNPAASQAASPPPPTPQFCVAPGRMPYTHESEGTLLAWTGQEFGRRGLEFEATLNGQSLVSRQPLAPPAMAAFSFPLEGLSEGTHLAEARLIKGDQALARQTVRIVKLPHKDNVVKIDYATRGLIVEGLPYFSMGFYGRHPLGDLPGDEVTQGFNNIIPFDYAAAPKGKDPRGHTADQLAEIRKQMDRCASMGMKVHFDIKVIAQEPPSPEKWQELRKELEAFKDHPALLAWYISDEPSEWKIPPGILEETYRFVKEVDPYHPVTIVFCPPENPSGYAKAMDILVADYYPIPVVPITKVSDRCDRLRRDLGPFMPIWIVPQAFGGGELWSREPSVQEERIMTYLAAIHGATGIQYFIRVPPVGNPKSSRLWSECRTLASEMMELAPVLLSPEPKGKVSCSPKVLHAASWTHEGHRVVIVANPKNEPVMARTFIHEPFTGEASVLFENRSVPVQWGSIQEPIDALGTRAYEVPVQPRPEGDVRVDPRNLSVNPSFEECANVGSPDGCYFSVSKDSAASALVDSRVARHGQRSLRLVTPAQGEGIKIRPFRAKAVEKDKTYILSIWAKAQQDGLEFEMTLSGGEEAGTQRFSLSKKWQECSLIYKSVGKKPSPSFKLLSPGTAWFDLLQIVPVE